MSKNVEDLRIRRAKELHKHISIQERIDIEKSRKRDERKKDRHSRKEQDRRITKEVNAGRY